MEDSTTARMSKTAIAFIAGCVAILAWIVYYFLQKGSTTPDLKFAFICSAPTILFLGSLYDIFRPKNIGEQKDLMLQMLIVAGVSLGVAIGLFLSYPGTNTFAIYILIVMFVIVIVLIQKQRAMRWLVLSGFLLMILFAGVIQNPSIRETVLPSLIIIIVVTGSLYWFFRRIYPEQESLPDVQDPPDAVSPEQRVELNLQYSAAFDLCMRTLQLFRFSRVQQFDYENGTVVAEVNNSLFEWGSLLTMSLEQAGMNMTNITITCRSLYPGGHGFTAITTANFKTVRSFLLGHGMISLTPVRSKLAAEETDGNSPEYWVLKNPVHAAVLSLIIPGLGQSYNNQPVQGFGLLLGWFAAFWLVGIPSFLIWFSGIAGAWYSARRINKIKKNYQPANIRVMVVHILAGIALITGTLAAWAYLSSGGSTEKYIAYIMRIYF
jgi:TM2 domain-containing membrane protein YozV